MVKITDEAFLGRLREVADQYKRRNQAAHTAGISVDQLIRYLRGSSQPSFLGLANLCRGVGYSIDWLAFGEGDKQIMSDDEFSVPMQGLSETSQKGWYNSVSWATNVSLDVKDSEAFAVVAHGDEMALEGIKQGTVCVCSPSQRPQKGDIVYIERIDGRSTIKIYQGHEGDWIAFQGYIISEKGELQDTYTDKLKKNNVKMVAPVVLIKKKL